MIQADSKNIEIDSPELISVRRKILLKKKFLKKIYEEWYLLIKERLPESNSPVLEIGSGAGFFREFSGSNVITSEILQADGVDLVFDACKGIPFKNKSLSAVVMTDVLHHLPDTVRFFSEAERVLENSGKIIMIEPWVTGWSKFIFKNFHHEPFDTSSADWNFASSGPLSGANGALPWIIFKRDFLRFKNSFPNLTVRDIRLMMPFRYLVSGGFSIPSVLPSQLFGLSKFIESAIKGMNGSIAMFALIEIIRK